MKAIRNNKTFHFKVQIDGITKPPVWRKIAVPADFTFYELHIAIQVSFGWENAHLFQFMPKRYSQGLCIKVPNEYDGEFGYSDLRDAEKTKLSDIFKKTGDKFLYEYDFGDSWEHKIVLEKIEEKVITPTCTAGKGKCPPEDCGGVWGYENFKEALADPNHEEHEDFLEWLGLDTGSDWDVLEFNINQINELLNNVFK